MAKQYIAFENLRVEMAINNVLVKDLAADINVTRDTMSKKLSRKSPINLDEALVIQKKHFPTRTVEFLFKELLPQEDTQHTA